MSEAGTNPDERATSANPQCASSQPYSAEQIHRLAKALNEQPVPETIGSYRILGLLGEGGMGVVYRAEQANPHRVVALKVVRPMRITQQLLRRFEHEVEVLARLQHPGLAQIFEAGTAETALGSQPFFAMELIQGPGGAKAPTLTEYGREKQLDTTRRLELITKVTDAVHYAHQKGVVHRDLKPGNILIDESGQPKILDFGVARVTNADVETTSLQTDVGQLVGTLQYMSPEQASGVVSEVDTRSDVYALGVITYELLVNRYPYRLSGRSIPEAVRTIRDDEPSRLSAVDWTLRGDVETIVSKALEKDKSRRYQSASEFAADIRRYLSDEPIMARPPTTWYQVRKFARRNRALVGGICGVLFVLVLGIAATTWQAIRARESSVEATAQKKVAEQNADSARLQEAEAKRNLHMAQMNLANQAMLEGNANLALQYLEANRPKTGTLDLRSFEWYCLWRACHGAQCALQLDTDEGILSSALSPDTRLVATATREAIFLWDIDAGRPEAHLISPSPSPRALAFAPDNRSLAVACGDESPSGSVSLWRAGKGIIWTGHDRALDPALAVTFTPDGRTLITGHGKLGTGYEVPEARYYGVIRGLDGYIATWDVDTGSVGRRFKNPSAAVVSLAVSRSGLLLVTGDSEGTVRLWDVGTGTMVRELKGHSSSVWAVEFSPDDQMLASSSGAYHEPGVVILWRVSTGAQLEHFDAHRAGAFSLAFSTDGRLLATGGWDQLVKLWPVSGSGLQSRRPTMLYGNIEAIRSLRFSPDCSTLAVACWGFRSTGQVRRWEFAKPSLPWQAAETQPEYELTVPQSVWPDGGPRRQLAPDGRIMVSLRMGASSSGSESRSSLGLVDTTTGQVLQLKGQAGRVRDFAISSDSRLLATCNWDNQNHIWEMKTGRLLHRLAPDPCTGLAPKFSPDSKLLVISHDYYIKCWNTVTGQLESTLQDHTDCIRTLAFSPDGQRMASMSWDGTVKLWDVGTKQVVLTLPINGYDGGFSRDGRLLRAGQTMWEAATEEEVTAHDLRQGKIPRLMQAARLPLNEWAEYPQTRPTGSGTGSKHGE
jgi:WD40 repeat protein/serine/threonine protein kinase